jgi:hypothetical protein
VADCSLSTFTLSDMIRCGAQLRSVCAGAESSADAATRVVDELTLMLVGPDVGRECVLVRFYQTVPYAELTADLQAFADRVLGDALAWPELPCLVLLASAGVEEAWNDPVRSQGHRAIPLPSPETVAASPMIAQLISQLGLELSALLEPDPDVIVDLDQKQYNVFHVPVAEGSPYIPAQDDFVVPYGVRSALGFGGMLPSGDMFAVVIFARVPIPRSTADLFRTIALSVKVGMLPVLGSTFAVSPT